MHKDSILKLTTISALILSIWLIFANLFTTYRVGVLLIFVPFLSFTMLVFFSRRKLSDLLNIIHDNKKRLLLVYASVILLSLLLRLLFLFLTYKPFSDPGVFFSDAQGLAVRGALNNPGYTALFPYTYAYDFMLSVAMKIIGVNLISVVSLNILFDLIATLGLYKLVKGFTNDNLSAYLAAFLWVVSPFTIIFSALSLPISMFNALVVVSLLIVYQTQSSIDSVKRFIFYNLILGVILAVANATRPLMAVFIIALFIYYISIILTHYSRARLINLVLGFLTIMLIFFGINSAYGKAVSSVTGYPSISTGYGWSLYVGSNLKSWGGWNLQDHRQFEALLSRGVSFSDAHKIMRSKALERLSRYTPVELAELVTRKAIKLGGDQKSSVYNLKSYPYINNRPTLLDNLAVILSLYTYIIGLLTVYYFYIQYRSKYNLNYIHYVNLVFVGLFLASLLVEVSSRYSAPFFVFLTIYSSMGLGMLLRKKATRIDS